LSRPTLLVQTSPAQQSGLLPFDKQVLFRLRRSGYRVQSQGLNAASSTIIERLTLHDK
jgi:hypothetical protein